MSNGFPPAREASRPQKGQPVLKVVEGQHPPSAEARIKSALVIKKCTI